jgi:hypothetical protein
VGKGWHRTPIQILATAGDILVLPAYPTTAASDAAHLQPDRPVIAKDGGSQPAATSEKSGKAKEKN